MLQASRTQLPKKRCRFGKSDPFVQICRPKETAKGTQFQPVFQTAVIKDDLNPQWPRQEVSLGRLCNGDLRSELLIRVREPSTAMRGNLLRLLLSPLGAPHPGALLSCDTSPPAWLQVLDRNDSGKHQLIGRATDSPPAWLQVLDWNDSGKHQLIGTCLLYTSPSPRD